MRDLLNLVEHDSAHIYVLRYDIPAAVLVPVDWYEAQQSDAPEA
jgi:PHD/YefM family antitoxin component YafN of YafNO toxin-antitoxin module